MNDSTLLFLAEESVRLAWLPALLLSAAPLPRAARALREMGARRVLPWVGVALLAVVVRLLAEPSFVHENRHGEMMYLHLLRDGHLLHGAGWFETYRLTLAFNPRLETVFATSAVIGALSSILAGLFAVTVIGAREREGLLAAVILALLPVHIRVSVSESPLVLAAFLTMASSAAVAFGSRNGRPSLVFAGFLLAVVAAQVRPIFMIFPAFLLALPLVACEREERLHLGWVLSAAALCAILLIPRALTTLLLAAEGDAVLGLSPHTLRNNILTEAHIVLNPRLFPVALTVLGAVGLGLLAYRAPRVAAWLAALLVLLTSWFLLMQQNLGAILRFQHAVLFVWVVLAAKGFFEILSLLDHRTGSPLRGVSFGALRKAPARIALSAGLLAAMVLTAAPTARIITHRFDKDIELAWLSSEAKEALPESGTLVLPGDRAFHDGRILLYFLPDVLPDRARGWTIVRQPHDAPLHPALLTATTDVFYYRGLWAYEFASDELPRRAPPSSRRDRYRANPFFDHERGSPGAAAWTATERSKVRPEIVELESRLVLEPLPDLPPYSFEARPFHRWIVPQKEPAIAFYRVVKADGIRVGGTP